MWIKIHDGVRLNMDYVVAYALIIVKYNPENTTWGIVKYFDNSEDPTGDGRRMTVWEESFCDREEAEARIAELDALLIGDSPRKVIRK